MDKYLQNEWSDPARNQTWPSFMPVLVTINFDDDSIKNERASMETIFSHYKCMENVLDIKDS